MAVPKTERNKAIIEAYENGMGQSALARQFGLSQPRVRNILIDAGVTTRKSNQNTQPRLFDTTQYKVAKTELDQALRDLEQHAKNQVG